MQISCEKEFMSGAEKPGNMFSKNTYTLPYQKLEERKQKKKKRNNTTYDLSFEFILRLIFFLFPVLPSYSSFPGQMTF